MADVIAQESATPADRRRDLEQTDQATLDEICGVIRRLRLDLFHYHNPKLLAANAEHHADDVVLSIFGGSISRSRMALVPAVCETMGLSFVGPDAYGRVICQDKEVSKSLAREAGLRVAEHRIVRIEEDVRKLAEVELPYVVKPLWEGSSIGIGSDSLVTDALHGIEVVERLRAQFEQPIMVEQFIPGREVSYCYIDPIGFPSVRALAEIVWDGKPDHFNSHLYDATHKQVAAGKKIVRVISSELQSKEAEAIETLLDFVGPTGYGRVDGKLVDGEFVFLEITPDAWLGSTGTFASSFTEQNLSFDEVIAHLLLSGRRVPLNPPTSG